MGAALPFALFAALSAGLALAACNPADRTPPPADKPGPTVTGDIPPPAAPPPPGTPPVTPTAYDPVEPIEPGRPGGLPDDRTPISEAPFTPQSAQGAADVVQTYFALTHAGRYDEARHLWREGALDEAGFAELKSHLQYDGQVGAPGRIEGAAGSSYVEAPVQIYGRTADGTAFHRLARVVLSRVNDVPGSTPVQRLWRIREIRTR
jgi:hypothetical protein